MARVSSLRGWLLLLVAVQAAQAQVALEERTRARVHTVRLRIEPTFNARPGECLDLGLEGLEVRLRGERIEDPALLDLDREHEPTLHALVIDTSGSMRGHLDAVRQAVSGYVAQLRPEDERVLVFTFDESVVLQSGATADRLRITEAMARIRRGGYTSMLDALGAAIQELGAHRERPVLLLLTDGVDSSSILERDDVLRLAGDLPELTVFTIGFDLPSVSSAGPADLNSSKRFLERLASATDGRYFIAPTGSRLERAYRRIRETLAGEAILTVVDPDPEGAPARPTVRSARPHCRVHAYRAPPAVQTDPARVPIRQPLPALPTTLRLVPDEAWGALIDRAHHAVVSDCSRQGGGSRRRDAALEALWTAEVLPDRIRGCTLDVTMEPGMLYDPFVPGSLSLTGVNEWIRLLTRPFEVPVPPLDALPRAPESWMDALGRFALKAAGANPEIDPRRRPREGHARPYHDYPLLVHGLTFFDLRPTLARALFMHDDYRNWVLERLRAEARRDLADLVEWLRRGAPGASEESLVRAARQSDRGRQILRRGSEPSERDLERHLAAWLGDLPAHDLFVLWERERIGGLLAGTARAGSGESFLAEWRELRRVFWVPSYSRVLTLLAPVHDLEGDRVGFYRVLLPRPSWIEYRVRAYHEGSDREGPPLDLVPIRPLGYRTVESLLERSADLTARMREAAYRPTALRYELLGRSGKQSPRLAFGECRVQLVLEATGEPSAPRRIDLEADWTSDGEEHRIVALRLSAPGDPVSESLARTAAADLVRPPSVRVR